MFNDDKTIGERMFSKPNPGWFFWGKYIVRA